MDKKELTNQLIEIMLSDLASETDDARNFVAEALGKIKELRAVPILINILIQTPRLNATNALVDIGDPVVPQLIDIATGTNKDEDLCRPRAIKILGEIGDFRAMAPLIKIAKNKERPKPERVTALMACVSIAKKCGVAPFDQL